MTVLSLTAVAVVAVGAASVSAAPGLPGSRPAAEAQDTCPAITKEAVAQGKTVFTGGGACYACHGPEAKGTPLAPDLTDSTWLQADGSYASIVGVIRTGVAQPKEHPAPMPAKGGANLSDAEVCAVGAYVHSLTHPVP